MTRFTVDDVIQSGQVKNIEQKSILQGNKVSLILLSNYDLSLNIKKYFKKKKLFY